VPIRRAPVSAMAGGSPVTASRVLTHLATVDTGLADRVRPAGADLRPEPHRVGGDRRRQQPGTIGILTSDIKTPRVAELVPGIDQAAVATGGRVHLGGTDAQPETPMTSRRIRAPEQVAEIFLSPTQDPARALRNPVRAVMPVVATVAAGAHRGNPADLVDTVMIGVDHRAIGPIAAPPAMATAVEPRCSCARALDRAERPAMVGEAEVSREDGRRAMERLLTLHPRIAAALVFPKLLTAGALAGLATPSVALPNRPHPRRFSRAPRGRSAAPSPTRVARPQSDRPCAILRRSDGLPPCAPL